MQMRVTWEIRHWKDVPRIPKSFYFMFHLACPDTAENMRSEKTRFGVEILGNKTRYIWRQSPTASQPLFLVYCVCLFVAGINELLFSWRKYFHTGSKNQPQHHEQIWRGKRRRGTTNWALHQSQICHSEVLAISVFRRRVCRMSSAINKSHYLLLHRSTDRWIRTTGLFRIKLNKEEDASPTASPGVG